MKDRDLWGTGSVELFLKAAESVDGLLTQAGMPEMLRELYEEYLRLLESENSGLERVLVSSEWNDEDVDEEEIREPELLPWNFEDQEDPEGESTAADAADTDLRFEGAVQQTNALREVTEEAKRILDELNGALAKVKPEQADFYQEMRAALAQVAALDARQTLAEEQLRLAELEEISYTCMVGKKGLFGILSGAQQQLQDISKESWQAMTAIQGTSARPKATDRSSSGITPTDPLT